jgi:hypothetical protein
MQQETLRQMARRLWGNNRRLRHKWFVSVRRLRHQSRTGWIIDRRDYPRMENKEQRA